MKMAWALCVLSIVLMTPSARAADTKADEAAIRAAATSEHAKSTDDAIFWSGAYKRPFILPHEGESFPEDRAGTRSNSKTGIDVQRIEVAASGDLAYEFSYGTLEYDQLATPPKHVAFKVGLLRVWKKVNGEWKIAATFARPLDIPFEKETASTTQ
jgi:ketosteroid isomerase-like protein